MNLVTFLLSHHIASVISTALAVVLAATVVRQRQPTGSAFAWLLAILLVPYVGIPLYLVLGGRKFRHRARGKSGLATQVGQRTDRQPGGASLDLARAESVEWLDDGVAAYEAMLREIRRARRSIRIVTFVVGDDATGRSLLDALAQRAAEGIEVLLLIDDLLRFRAPRGPLRRLVAAGGRVRRFMPLIHLPLRARSNLRNHRKIAVFDGERALVGGMNLAEEYMGPRPDERRWRDLSVVAAGPCVATLDAVLCSDWQFAAGENVTPVEASRQPAPGGVPVEVVPSGPDQPHDSLYDRLLQEVYSARLRIWIATPYFAPDEALLRALESAARRGLDVRVIVPKRSNHPFADLVGASMLRDLVGQGIRVFRHLPTMLHAKVLLVDDSLAAIGSANFDMRSLFLDYEVALLFSGEAEVARLGSWFTATLAATAEGTPRASWLLSLVEPWARLLAPLV